MSFGIFVQGFREGDRRDADATRLRSALEPHLVKATHGWNLRAGNATAEIYGVDDLTTGFMVTHVDGPEIYDVIVRVGAACDLVILAPGVAAALTHRDQRAHVPEELRASAVVVASGAELVALIESS
jgi:hypothetical protein